MTTHAAVAAPPKRRKRRVFVWVFAAVQVLFIAWMVTGLATDHTGPTAAQLAQGCGHHHWWPLFKSHADCMAHFGHALQDAGNAGKGIGVALGVALWVVVDFLMAVSYGIYRLARKP